MKEYEVIIEHMNPCGGSKHATREMLEIEAESPLSYVEENKRFPIDRVETLDNGDVKIVTKNDAGYIDCYTFTE